MNINARFRPILTIADATKCPGFCRPYFEHVTCLAFSVHCHRPVPQDPVARHSMHGKCDQIALQCHTVINPVTAVSVRSQPTYCKAGFENLKCAHKLPINSLRAQFSRTRQLSRISTSCANARCALPKYRKGSEDA